METRIGLGKYRLFIALNCVAEVTGVDSCVDQKKDIHFLLWDFDGVELDTILEELAIVQETYVLPPIYVISTGKPGGYHAYCLHAAGWVETRTVIAATPSVDDKYLALGLARHYFTLRYTEPEAAHRFAPVGTLDSPVAPNIGWEDVTMFSRYFKVLRKKEAHIVNN